jgi:hypothetical protein
MQALSYLMPQPAFAVLHHKPWGEGAVYILPRGSFTQEPEQQMSGVQICFTHWICHKPVKPLASLIVQPQDFPFLGSIHGHNDERLVQLTAADPNGFPWPGALEP